MSDSMIPEFLPTLSAGAHDPGLDSLIAENARLANVIQQVRELAQSAKADRDGSLLAAATDFHGRPFPVYVDAESILRILDQEQTYTTSELENR